MSKRPRKKAEQVVQVKKPTIEQLTSCSDPSLLKSQWRSCKTKTK